MEELNSSLLEGVELCSNSVDPTNTSMLIKNRNNPYLASKKIIVSDLKHYQSVILC